MNQDALKHYEAHTVSLRLCKEEIAQLRKALTTHDNVKGSMEEHPWIERIIKIEGVPPGDGILYKRLQELQRREKQIQEEIEGIEEFIRCIPDKTIQTMVGMRYIRGYSWEYISNQFGKDDEGFSRRRVERYMSRYK